MDLANTALEETVLGKGVKSPLETNPTTGGLVTLSGSENVRNCIMDLISTRVGQRVMREDYGIEASDQLFENPLSVVDVVPLRIVEGIRRFEKRVKDVRAVGRQISNTLVHVEVSWTLRSTGARDSLVYPFYVSPPYGGVNNG